MYFLLLNEDIFPSFKMSTHMRTRNLVQLSYYESDQEDNLSDEDYSPSSEKKMDDSIDDDSDEEYLPNHHIYKKTTTNNIKMEKMEKKSNKQNIIKCSIGRLSLRNKM